MSERAQTKPTRILSIDGGGIRGVIPAVILAAIEEKTGKPIADLFDVIAGTSTGGIIAAGLTVPDGSMRPKYAAEDLFTLYRKHGPSIFAEQWWRGAISWFNGPKYSARPLEECLAEYFGETMLSDALVELLVTTYNMADGTAWFFRRADAIEKPHERDHRLRDVTRATSAAPTYFPPLRLPASGSQPEAVLVDGGMFANNPGVCAWIDAHRGTDPRVDEEPILVSLGTGAVERKEAYATVSNWGKLGWAQPAFSSFLDGESETVGYQLGRLLPTDRYWRLQPSLPADLEAMDDGSNAHVEALRVVAEGLLRTEAATFERLCAAL